MGAGAVTAVLGVELAGRGGQFSAALQALPASVLALAAALQIGALVARTEAWHVCVRATGADVGQRVLFRAAGVGYLASIVNGSLGLAARIACLRRSAPQTSPRVPALLAAEVPIITVEVTLAAVFSFTLIGPLGVAWYVPLIAVITMSGAMFALRRLSEHRRIGLWSGLAVMRSGRGQMILLVLLAVCAQVARNWLVLRGIGVHVSIFDAMALLIAMFTLGQLPVGPSLGAAAAVLILGAHGVATTAAAGLLLTATATAGSLTYAAWALSDRFLEQRLDARRAAGGELASLAPLPEPTPSPVGSP
ncbi:MAG TPA: hypothetical protein VLP43_08160 [Solirubrobacteraceae bacterium]|nr:hypothetical protein [Solirubrobacteraceae bacterium]